MRARRACGRRSGRSRLRHLLTHTAGFGYGCWDAELVRYVEATGIPSIKHRQAASLRLPLMFDPGERWEYGINIDWVGRAVEAVSGKPLEAYFREHIFGPLGMADTGFVLSAEQRTRGQRPSAQAGRITGAEPMESRQRAGSSGRRRRSLFDWRPTI